MDGRIQELRNDYLFLRMNLYIKFNTGSQPWIFFNSIKNFRVSEITLV